MKRLIVIAALASTGCDDSFQKSGTKEEVARLSVQVTELEGEIRSMKQAEELQAKYIDALSASLEEARANHTRLLNTFNGNVDQNNAAKLRDATNQGLCGRETVQFADGSWTYRNRECTWKLLGK